MSEVPLYTTGAAFLLSAGLGFEWSGVQGSGFRFQALELTIAPKPKRVRRVWALETHLFLPSPQGKKNRVSTIPIFASLGFGFYFSDFEM